MRSVQALVTYLTGSNITWLTHIKRGAAAALMASLAAVPVQAQDSAAPNPLAGLKLRNIGPAYPSGRISDFAMMPGGSNHYLVSTASGGLWRTTNNGTTWTPIFDREASFAIGVVEIAPSDSSTIWVGTGENNAQRSVGYGDGVYKSTDGGKSWKNMGLKDSGHISQIWIHPEDSNHVLVAAQGPLWSNGGDRGLYRTTDGGTTWTRILEIDAYTGINEFVVDANDPNRIVASSYQRRRHVWTLINGGPGSGIHRTEDGGTTWTKVTGGLPSDNMGRIGLAAAPSAPSTVYAIIEANAKERGLYRSQDFGRTWSKRSGHSTTSPQYYNELVVDPHDADTLYSLDTFSSVSRDGGKSFSRLSAAHRHVDDHALWVDPANTGHLLMGGDGGVYESWDGGQVWRHAANLPIVQFYRIQPDNAEPFYNVCGGTQDNNSLCGPSRSTNTHGVTNSDWHIIVGGDGYKPQIDPNDPNIVYGQYQYGGLARYDRRNQELLYIAPMPDSGETTPKWNWNTPLLISPHNPTTLYYAAERVYQSDDRGNSWRAISPDLTRQIDRNALEVMDRVWSVDSVAKNASTSFYGSIIAFSESPVEAGLLYAGTDDGVIAVSEDGGATWNSQTKFRGVPDMSLVEDIIASVHDANVAYAVFDNHKRGDYAPYVYKTTNRGKTWRAITGNLPERGSAHTIAEDHVNPNLLFVGTEFGLFVTQQGGNTWHQMKGNLPTIAVRDLEIQRRENDLVVGTFGRGVYILDDYSPLRTPASDIADADATVFGVRDTWLYMEGSLYGAWGGAQAFNGDDFWFGENPPFGAVFTYHLKDSYKSRAKTRRAAEIKKEKAGEDTPYPSWEELRAEDREIDPALKLTVRDTQGNVIRRVKAPASKGLHRVAWDLRYDRPDPASRSDGSSLLGGTPTGPMVVPGVYTVTLELVKDETITTLSEPQSFTVKALTRSPEETSDRAGLLAFQQRLASLVRAGMGTGRYLSSLNERLGLVRIALEATPDADQGLRDRVKAIASQLETASIALNGDRTIASRNEPTPMSIFGRVGTLRFATGKSQADVAAQHRQSLEIAEAEFKAVKESVAAASAALDALQKDLSALGAPWTPGQLPVWPTESR